MADWTEESVADVLDKRYSRQYGNGRRYLTARQVRNRAGFDATRTFDYVVVDLWPSSGLAVDVIEIKVSRSDWKRELAQPWKAGEAVAIADRFWIAAPAGLIPAKELPDGWGLLMVYRDHVRVGRAARPLRLARPETRPSWTFAVSLLRAVARQPSQLPAGPDVVCDEPMQLDLIGGVDA